MTGCTFPHRRAISRLRYCDSRARRSSEETQSKGRTPGQSVNVRFKHGARCSPLCGNIERASYQLVPFQPKQVHNSLSSIEHNDPAAKYHYRRVIRQSRQASGTGVRQGLHPLLQSWGEGSIALKLLFQPRRQMILFRQTGGSQHGHSQDSRR